MVDVRRSSPRPRHRYGRLPSQHAGRRSALQQRAHGDAAYHPAVRCVGDEE